jgi:hypothetical protein
MLIGYPIISYRIKGCDEDGRTRRTKRAGEGEIPAAGYFTIPSLPSRKLETVFPK